MDKLLKEKIDRIFSTKGRKKMKNYFSDLIKTSVFKERAREIQLLFDNAKSIKDYDFIARKIKTLARDNNLDSDDWFEILENYIRYKKIPDGDYPDLCKYVQISEMNIIFSDNYENINGQEELYSAFEKKQNLLSAYTTALLIGPNTSKRDIINFVENNELKMRQKNNYFSKRTIFSPGKSRKKNSLIQERNEFIWKNRKLKSKEIIPLIFKQFGTEGIYDLEESSVRKIISNERQKRENK